jgi:hypothetical protein
MPNSAPMAEGTAVFFVFACTGAALFFSVRRSLVVPVFNRQALIGRYISVGILSFVWWFVVIVLATIVGNASGKNTDLLIMPVLLIVSIFGVIQGRRMTLPGRPPMSQRERTATVVLWTCATVMTLGACAELAGSS